MNTEFKALAKVHNFSAAFEQMCSIVAIGKTRDTNETLKELVLHCLVYLPDDKFFSASDFVKTANELLGIQILEHEIQFVLDQLIKSGSIARNADESFVVPESLRRSIQKRINNAYELEAKVRNGWEKEIKEKYSILDFAQTWRVLKLYLARAFQRHGIQTVALLDPAIEIAQEYSDSLSSILNSVISKEFSVEIRNSAQNAISEFMATTGNHPERATYIAQLADGAFNYYSLTIDPKIATEFRKSLNSLVIFFDTNFLFGILDLTINPQVGVSNELLNAIVKYKLPFKLYSHQKTIAELQSSIDHYAEVLATRKWSPQLSRAAARSRLLSGVELRYHQRHANEGIDVDGFFSPFRHADVLLKNKNIVPYNSQENRTDERAMLVSEYIGYLAKRNKEKLYELIDHDMTVLDVVRQKRTNAKSTLEAGALFITCDFSLYRFDWEDSKAKGIKPSTVLPNVLWQVLRPFVPSDVDFDRSFAETFALPEFRIFGSKASEACSKMLSILAGYKDLPEETATRMLSSDMLIKKLQSVTDQKAFREMVESEIVEANVLLLEEKAMMAKQLEKQRAERKQAQEALEAEREKRMLREAEIEQEYMAKQLAEQRAARAEQAQKEAEQATKQAKEEKDQAIEKAEEKARKEKERADLVIGTGKSILLAALCIAIFEFAIFRMPFQWLLNHQNSIGIQLSIDSILLLLPIMLFIPKSRLWVLGTLIVPIIIGLYSILGK
jgi:hypothetical protein